MKGGSLERVNHKDAQRKSHTRPRLSKYKCPCYLKSLSDAHRCDKVGAGPHLSMVYDKDVEFDF